jgi:hypothetical protein
MGFNCLQVLLERLNLHRILLKNYPPGSCICWLKSLCKNTINNTITFFLDQRDG